MNYSDKTNKELRDICKDRNITGISKKTKQELIDMIQQQDASNPASDATNTLSEKILEDPNANVLTLCEMPKSLDIEKMKELVSSYMKSRTEYYKHKGRSPFVEDEFSEYFTAQTTQGTEIGGGSCGMDVKTSINEGIDAMCVIMNGTTSNEKSLMQNFSSSGANLDTLFIEKKDDEAIQLFVDQYSKKLIKTKNEKKLTDLFILAFITTRIDVHIVCFKINLENVKNVSSGGFVNEKKAKCVNINVNNFIDPNHGKVVLYKSKKRLELRLCKKVIESEHAVKIYTMN
jgi:hypothetical protein